LLIKKLNLNTPGRAQNTIVGEDEVHESSDSTKTKQSGSNSKNAVLGKKLLAAVGGKENVKNLE
jgi:hypothetical protein